MVSSTKTTCNARTSARKPLWQLGKSGRAPLLHPLWLRISWSWKPPFVACCGGFWPWFCQPCKTQIFLSENCPGSVFWPFSLIFCDFLAGGVWSGCVLGHTLSLRQCSLPVCGSLLCCHDWCWPLASSARTSGVRENLLNSRLHLVWYPLADGQLTAFLAHSTKHRHNVILPCLCLAHFFHGLPVAEDAQLCLLRHVSSPTIGSLSKHALDAILALATLRSLEWLLKKLSCFLRKTMQNLVALLVSQLLHLLDEILPLGFHGTSILQSIIAAEEATLLIRLGALCLAVLAKLTRRPATASAAWWHLWDLLTLCSEEYQLNYLVTLAGYTFGWNCCTKIQLQALSWISRRKLKQIRLQARSMECALRRCVT